MTVNKEALVNISHRNQVIPVKVSIKVEPERREYLVTFLFHPCASLKVTLIEKSE